MQLDNQYILRLLFNILDIFKGASIILPTIIIALNFRAPQPPQPRQPNQNLRIRSLSSPTEIISFVSIRADSVSFSSILPVHSAAAAAAAAAVNLYIFPLPNQAAASLAAVQVKISLL